MDVDSSSKSGISSMMPLALGILGVLLGGIALIMSLGNSSKLAVARTDIDAATQAASDAKTAAAAAGGLSAKLDATSSKLDAFVGDVQSALTQYKQVITDDHTKLMELTDNVGKMGKSAASAPRSGGGEAASNVVPGQGGTHTIVSGDTFSTLARKYNVSVKAIEDANPGVDSTKLKLGQVITIPGSSRSSPGSSAPRATPPAETNSPAPAPASAVSTS